MGVKVIMNKKDIIEHFLQRGNLLNTSSKLYLDYLDNYLIPLMQADFVVGDKTTELVFKKDSQADAIIIAKQKGIVSGIEEAKYIYGKLGIDVNDYVSDGKEVNHGEIIMEISGSIKSILRTERMILNLLGRMSGISTMTAGMKKLAGNTIQIAATRKTLALYTDKKAVFIGGGLTHRLSLSDGVMIKDNHLEAMRLSNISLEDAFHSIYSGGTDCITAEAESDEQSIKIYKAFDSCRKKSTKEIFLIILLDNMRPAEIKKSIYRFAQSEKKNILFE